jgi:hypothetical protein
MGWFSLLSYMEIHAFFAPHLTLSSVLERKRILKMLLFCMGNKLMWDNEIS